MKKLINKEEEDAKLHYPLVLQKANATKVTSSICNRDSIDKNSIDNIIKEYVEKDVDALYKFKKTKNHLCPIAVPCAANAI